MALLFELIQVVLGQRDRLSRTPSEEDWQSLFQMAEEQAITSFAYVGRNSVSSIGQNQSLTSLLN